LGGHAAPFVSSIANRLRDSNEAVRRVAAEVLGKMGEHAAPYVEGLVACLGDSCSSVCQAAASSLSELRPLLGEHADEFGDLAERYVAVLEVTKQLQSVTGNLQRFQDLNNFR